MAAMAVMVVVAATANRATGNRAVCMARVAAPKPKGYVVTCQWSLAEGEGALDALSPLLLSLRRENRGAAAVPVRDETVRLSGALARAPQLVRALAGYPHACCHVGAPTEERVTNW